MPAVHLPTLKLQIDRLAWQFTRPAEFQAGLHELLEYYADLTFRAGQAVQARPLMPSYRVTPLVLHQIEQELAARVAENAGAALPLADLLWQDEMLEPRRIAAYLLGQIPPNPPEEILQRLLSWATPEVENHLLTQLLKQGSFRLRREQPRPWFGLIEHWLTQKDTDLQRIGIQALLPFIEDRDFENLPPIYNLLGPVLQAAPAALLPELQTVIQGLAHRSSTETLHFTRQMLATSTNPTLQRLIRRCLPAFSVDDQAKLRPLIARAPAGS